jgi:hypothetical protein
LNLSGALLRFRDEEVGLRKHDPFANILDFIDPKKYLG